MKETTWQPRRKVCKLTLYLLFLPELQETKVLRFLEEEEEEQKKVLERGRRKKRQPRSVVLPLLQLLFLERLREKDEGEERMLRPDEAVETSSGERVGCLRGKSEEGDC